jgi:hypothetical protein
MIPVISLIHWTLYDSINNSDIALDIEALVIDSSDILTLSSSANMTPGDLSKQRLFVQCLPILLAALQNTPIVPTSVAAATSPRTRLLLALATLLRHQSRPVMLAHLPMVSRSMLSFPSFVMISVVII